MVPMVVFFKLGFMCIFDTTPANTSLIFKFFLSEHFMLDS